MKETPGENFFPWCYLTTKKNTLMEENEYRYLVIDVTVDSATAVNSLQEFNVQLDRDYNIVSGIAFHLIDDGGAGTNFNVGARTNRKTWVDLVNYNNWNAEANISPDLKYRTTNIGYGAGDSFYCQVTLGAALTTDLIGQMVLRLERSLNELPH